MKSQNSYCSACDHYTMVQGHCSFCGHQLKTIPWRTVWEILEKFLPGMTQWRSLPFQVRSSLVFQKQIQNRGLWLLDQIKRESSETSLSDTYKMELNQIQSWFGQSGPWAQFQIGDQQAHKNFRHLFQQWAGEVKQKKSSTIFAFIAAIFLAPFVAHIFLKLFFVMIG